METELKCALLAIIFLTVLTISTFMIALGSLVWPTQAFQPGTGQQLNKTFCGPETGHRLANQTLHRLINSVPIDSLALRYPRFINATRYGIILLVISDAYERKHRDEIRKTWASRSESKMQETEESLVIFVVGRSSELEEEAATHFDLLQVDIDDCYRNLVYKIEVGFRWLKDSVDSKFVAKIDSDNVVHIDRLYRRLQRYEKERGASNWIECQLFTEGSPIRDPSSKWYVAKEDYPLEYYPTFCSGPGYVMKRATFEKIVTQMKFRTIIEPEDVFFTGIVANNSATHFNTGVAVNPYTGNSLCDSDGPVLSIVSTHQYRKYQLTKKNMANGWKQLKNPNCLKPRVNRNLIGEPRSLIPHIVILILLGYRPVAITWI